MTIQPHQSNQTALEICGMYLTNACPNWDSPGLKQGGIPLRQRAPCPPPARSAWRIARLWSSKSLIYTDRQSTERLSAACLEGFEVQFSVARLCACWRALETNSNPVPGFVQPVLWLTLTPGKSNQPERATGDTSS